MNFHQIPNTYVRNVHLKVKDLDRSRQFYQEAIGFSILKEVDGLVYLTADGKVPLLILEEIKDVVERDRRTTGLYHFALLLPKRSDLANIVKHFAEIRIPIASADHLVSEAIYLSDPDGNGIEIYIDRDPSEWTWHDSEVEMTVDPLDFDNLLTELTDEEWTGLLKDTTMGHIHLHVSCLTEAKDFYVKGLGFEVVSKLGNEALFVSSGKYHHHIGLNIWNGIGAPAPHLSSTGLKSYTIVYPSEAKRAKVIQQLKEIGAPIQVEADSVMTEDRSGNRIKLVV